MSRFLKAELLQSSSLILWTFPYKNPILRNDVARICALSLTNAIYCDLVTIAISF